MVGPEKVVARRAAERASAARAAPPRAEHRAACETKEVPRRCQARRGVKLGAAACACRIWLFSAALLLTPLDAPVAQALTPSLVHAPVRAPQSVFWLW
jgi:hypothetical protein